MEKLRLPGILWLAALLSGIWYLLSGMMDLLHFGTGVVVALLIAANFEPIADVTKFRPLRFLFYVPWLIGQIVISNLRVARAVLSPRLAISPVFVSAKPGVDGPRALTLLGCSVTLTPGTVTVDIGEDEIFVHALESASAQDIRDQVMSRHVNAVFVPGGEG